MIGKSWCYRRATDEMREHLNVRREATGMSGEERRGGEGEGTFLSARGGRTTSFSMEVIVMRQSSLRSFFSTVFSQQLA